ERRQGVVRHFPRPHQIPERLEEVGGKRGGRRLEIGEERSAALAQLAPELVGQLSFYLLWRSREQAVMVGQVQRDPAVAASDRLDAAPDQLSGGEEDVEVAR